MQEKYTQKINEFLQAFQQVPDERRGSILDFVIEYTKNKIKKPSNSKPSFAWIGSLSKVEASPLQLQKEAIDRWGNVDDTGHCEAM